MKKVCTILLCPLFLSILLVAGCGKNVPMSGKVTFSDDGSPLTVGTVCFVMDNQYARGKLDQNGRYVLGFEKPGSGLPKGEYIVYVVDAKTESGTEKDVDGTEMPVYSSLIDEKFAAAASSGLKFTVDGSKKTFDFQVDRAPKAK